MKKTKRVFYIIALILFLILCALVAARTTVVFANPVEVKVSWDPNDENENCQDACVSYGGPRAEGYSLPADASNYIIFTDKEFLEADCSFPFVNTFKRSTLAVGNAVYTDRDYTFTEVPAEFSGFKMIMTPNDNRADTSETGFIDFSVPSDSTVYVAFDSRYTALPNWLRKFTKLNKVIKTSLTTQTQMDLYALKYRRCFIKWQSIEFFTRLEGGEYNREAPLTVLSQSYVDGKSTPTETVLNIEYENFVVSKQYLMLKACAMVSTEKICSDDSDEVPFEYDMTRPPRTVLSMNRTSTDYEFVWTDTGARTKKYQLQYSFRDPAVNRGGYSVIRTVDAPALSVSIPAEEIQGLMGDNEKMWLTMVSITKEMIYSRWTEVDVEITSAAVVEIPTVKNIRVSSP